MSSDKNKINIEESKCIICNTSNCDFFWENRSIHSKCIDNKFKPKSKKIKLQHDEDISNPPFLR
jgi:hypothetical protein